MKQQVEERLEKKPELSSKRCVLIFINLIISCVASSLLTTALTTALNAIAYDFSIDVSVGQWMTSGYSLAMAIMLPLTAYFIKRFPTRKLYITSVAIFVAGTVVCLISQNFTVMMIGRIMQACSGGVMVAMAQVIIMSIFPKEKRGSMMGFYALAYTAAPVIAPTLAGFLVDSAGWRMIFTLTLGIMIFSLIFAFIVMRDVLETAKNDFDLASFVLSIFAFGGLTLGIGNLSSGITQPMTFGPLAIGIVTIIIFVRRQLKLTTPFLNVKVFKTRAFAVGSICCNLLYMVMMATQVLIPVHVQSVLGKTATIAGLILLPGSLIIAIVSPLSGKIYDKMGIKKMGLVGVIILLIGMAGMVFSVCADTILGVTVLNVIRNLAIGCLMMPLITWTIGAAGEKNTADGTAISNAMNMMCGSIGAALFLGIMNSLSKTIAPLTSVCITFGIMCIIGVVMFILILTGVKQQKQKTE